MNLTSLTRKNGISAAVIKLAGTFTGVEMLKILCSIAKMKLVALWLHAAGVGLFGVFNTSIETISTLSELGLRQSAVRDIARHKGMAERLRLIIGVVRRWSWVAGLLGAVVISALSPLLSSLFLGEVGRWWMFALLAFTMLMNALLNGENAILQGSGYLKALAKGAAYGNLSGLVLSIPMFRFLGTLSVPLSFIAYALAQLAFVVFFVGKCRLKGSSPSWKATLKEGKSFVRLGVFMAIAAFTANIAQISFMAYLNHAASMSEVGLFQAGYAILVRYVGLVFSAISMEFFPRLASHISSSWRTQVFVSHEISLLLNILTPIVIIFLMLRTPIVHVLYSAEFQPVVPFITLGIFGTLLRLASVTMAFVIVAKGEGRTYVCTEVADSIVWVILGITFYRLFGLVGLGIAYVCWYALYLLMTGLIYRIRYGFRIAPSARHRYLFSLLLGASASVWAYFTSSWISFAGLAALFLVALTLPLSHVKRQKKPAL